MTKQEVVARIKEIGILPSVRLSSTEDALFAAEAVASGGIPIVEVTMTVPGAVQAIQELARQNPQIVVGAGTVFDVDMARRCLDAGAAYLTSPGLDREVVEFGLKNDATVIPGALTPTEVMAAWKSGADFVKIYPCSPLGGPHYIATLRGPFPHVPFIAAGGVTQQTAADLIIAGATAIGIGANLIQPDAIYAREPDWIRLLARRFAKLVKDAQSVRDLRGHGQV
ncbi:MAG TPA: bifunctional 4-hydroxy-2-oxoglutarate aldolase/2-dehydro-3-deoxy-phosphogluconate aldolase [Bryobacteraceae bacterium]|jgi:2-dehydro-3-deoxyphosphogluconate aldolase/(4S)-4-hydroxy-2-oxoglutarate aldolase